MEGEYITPNLGASTTMDVPGAIGNMASKSIDPVDYMGQSFQYQSWLNDQKKKYDAQQQNQQDIAAANKVNELSNIKSEYTDTQKKIDDYRSSPEYTNTFNKFVQDQKKLDDDWNYNHPPVMGGSYEVRTSALQNYQKDYDTAKKAVDTSLDSITNATTKDDYDTAKKDYEKALGTFETIAKINPGSDEGKQKYQETITSGINNGISYANGFGLGGYHGYGAGSPVYADQLAANITGTRVGQSFTGVIKSPGEVMKDLGYTPKINPGTGNIGYYNSSGNLFVGEIPGSTPTSKYGQQYKFVTSDSNKVLSNMISRISNPTDEQLTQAATAGAAEDLVNKENIYTNLVTQYKLNPTDENSNTVSNYAAQAFSQDSLDKKYSDILVNLKGFGASPAKDVSAEPRARVGSVLDADIYSDKSGNEYIMPGLDKISLSTVTNARNAAGKTGGYSLFNNPSVGGSNAVNASSDSAKQWLYTTFGTNKTGNLERTLQPVGTTIVNNVSLPIVEDNGREYVKPLTGSLIPLTDITELKNLSTKSGEFRNDNDLYTQEIDYIQSYKQLQIDPTSATNQAYFTNASKNLTSNPSITPEKINILSDIVKIGSPFAGMTLNDKGTFSPETNIAGGILSFTSKSPVDNVIDKGIITRDVVDNNPVVKDVITAMPKYGDPIIGTSKFLQAYKDNADVGNKIDLLNPSAQGYGNMVDTIAKATASPSLKGHKPFFNIPDTMKIGYVSPVTQPVNQAITLDSNEYTISDKPVSGFGSINQQQYLPKNIQSNTGNIGKIGNLTAGNITLGKPTKTTNLNSVLVTGANNFKNNNGNISLSVGALKNTTSMFRKEKKSKPKVKVTTKTKKHYPGKIEKKDLEFDNIFKNSDLISNTMKFTIPTIGIKKRKVK